MTGFMAHSADPQFVTRSELSVGRTVPHIENVNIDRGWKRGILVEKSVLDVRSPKSGTFLTHKQLGLTIDL
jgi:hypothetical protein